MAIGFVPESTSQHPLRFAKQPGVTVGGAGFASNAFGFANFGCKQSTVKTKNNNDTIDTYKASNPPCDANKPTLGMTRNPPHAFGAGYTQKLAQEMTITLQDLLEKAKASPGKSVALKTKGISFGSVVATADGKIDTSKSNIEGVGNDLVVT